MQSQHDILRQCFDIALAPAELPALDDAELAALIQLQFALSWQGEALECIDSSCAALAAAARQQCSRTVAEALSRLQGADAADRMTAYCAALFPIAQHFPALSRQIEQCYERCLDAALQRHSHTPQQECALVGAYALLHSIGISYDNPNRQYVRGREQAQAIAWRWLTDFDPANGWSGLSVADALDRIQWLECFELQNALRLDRGLTAQIFWRYLADLGAYAPDDYARALALRASNIDEVEAPYAAADLAAAPAALAAAPTRRILLLTATALIHLLASIHTATLPLAI